MSNSKFTFSVIQSQDILWFNECRNLVREFLHDCKSFTIDETREFLKTNSRNYKIVSLNNIRIGYLRLVMDLESKQVMIGLDIHPEHQGKKYSRQIYNQFMSETYTEYGIKDYYLRVLKTNERAMNLYSSMGFSILEETKIDYLMTYEFIGDYEKQ